MHEWGITRDLVDEVVRQARQNMIRRVSRVEVKLGRKSHLTDRALRLCFKALTKDELLLAGTRLVVQKTPDHRIIVSKISGEGTGNETVRFPD